MAGGFDYQEFRKFHYNYTSLSRKLRSWLKDFILKEGMRFIATVKPLTPVDTGDLRNHWNLNGIEINGSDVTCWFVNSMEYATFVEYGHAKPYMSGKAQPGFYLNGEIVSGDDNWVNGSFMMTISLEYINENMPQEFDYEFNKFLGNLGVR